MPRRIDEDHKDFHDVYGGRKRKELKKFIKNGQIFRNRGKDGKIIVTIPKIDIPHIVYGDNGGGVGRGQGNEGDVIKKDKDGKGQGRAGQGQGDGIDIAVDVNEVLSAIQDELELPDMKSKPSDTYDEVIKRYNNISLSGPESLRHNRRTLMQSLKRQCADGSINKLHKIPGFSHPVKLITPINSDKRFRQFNEIKIPASNAVIFFARDGSGSMDQYRCDIVSDMAWWIDAWIRQFYKKVERCYIWHDTVAKEVDENKFYKHRYGGGTTCSSALKMISDTFENRYRPSKWNIYVFYFTDGDNWEEDNATYAKLLKEKFGPDVVNMVGITQVLSWRYEGSLKHYVDTNLSMDNLRTTAITIPGNQSTSWGRPPISEDDRDQQIKDGIIDLLGRKYKVKS